jgi:DNA polymerase III alpha subunit
MLPIPLFKTHYSLGRGIIQVNEYNAEKPSLAPNLADLCVKHEIKQAYVVDDSLGGIWPIFKTLKAVGTSVVFGLRINFVTNAEDKGETSNVSSHKNILFVKNEAGYKELIKISSKAHVDFFHSQPRLDYNHFHSIGTENLVLAVPFYDSFIYQNLLTENQCVPDFRKLRPTFFVENNNLPIDGPLAEAVRSYAANIGSEVLETQSVYYEKPEDCIAYVARRCMDRSFGRNKTLSKPELPHFGSNKFCLVK